MLASSINIALSGISAAEARLSASASNVANQQTTSRIAADQIIQKPFDPLEVSQSSLPNGGTVATIRPSGRASVEIYDPENIDANAEGIVEYPDIELGEEFANQILAENAFRFSAKLLEILKETEQFQLDIIT